MISDELLKEYENDMLLLVNNGGGEEGHMRADDILCDLLECLGFHNIVDIYKNVDKWYS